MRPRTALTTGLSAAALLLLTACGGSTSDTASGSATSSAAATSSTSATSSTATGSVAPADAAFCEQAQQSLGAVTAAVSSAQSDPTQLSAALQSAATELGGIEPPAEISTDWQTLVDGAQQLADATAGVDISTPEGQAQVSAQLGQLNTTLDPASTRVQTYLQNTCGLASPTG